jgi:hypothetical protein
VRTNPYANHPGIPQSWSRHSQVALRYKGKEAPADSFDLSEPEKFPQLGGRVAISGHCLSDPQHSQYPSSRYEIRCYAPSGQGQVHSLSFEELVAAQRRPFQREFSFEVQGDAGTASRARVKEGSLAPKDHSLMVESMDMIYEGWGVNQRYFRQLTEIGQIEQFQVRGMLKPEGLKIAEENLTSAGYNNFNLHPSSSLALWLEDYSEPLLGGGRVVPASFALEGKTVAQVIEESRQERLGPLGLQGGFSKQGSVNSGKYQQVGGALGQVYNEPVYQADSYIEGGNLISGRRPDGTPYVLVGQDSLALTRELLTSKLGRPPSEQEVRQTVAQDYGVKAEHIFGVEQPGEFHLDMRMTPIAPGVIALQDSALAARMQAKWIREELGETMTEDWNQEVEAMIGAGDQAARYEALARQDLERAGLKVVPLAGAFRNMDNLKVDGANFFNARHGTNSEGEKFTIMMGGTSKQENYIADYLLGQGHLQADRLYFMDPEQNHEVLPQQGGLKCRTKTNGRLVSGQ